MRHTKVLMALLVVVVAAIVWQVYSQKATVADLQKRLDAMHTKLEAQPYNASIDLQEKCAKQAREQYRQSGLEKEAAAGFSNHYNEKFNKCFMVIENTDAKTTPGTIWTHKTLIDAFEGKVFATYAWHTVKDKKHWRSLHSSAM